MSHRAISVITISGIQKIVIIRVVLVLDHLAGRLSKKRSLSFDLTKEWVLDRLTAGVCEVSGLPFELSKSDRCHRNPYGPSIDKIDSLGGYTQDNCRVVLNAINIGMNQWGLAEYKRIAAACIQYGEINE